MDQIALIVGCFIVPLCAVLSNLSLRHAVRAPCTAGADLVLFLLTLDAAVLIANEEFKLLIQSELLRSQLIEIFVGFTFITILLWIFNVVVFEIKVIKSFNSETGVYSNYPIGWVIFSWSLIVALVCAHLLVFSLQIDTTNAT